jgi:hypothetical protein
MLTTAPYPPAYSAHSRAALERLSHVFWCCLLITCRGALWAGIATLSEAKELLGGELRDVFDAHPPQPLQPGEGGPGPLDDMQVWTPEGRDQPWPYGVEWFRDTYPKPHWVAVREAAEAAKQQQQEATAASSSSSSSTGGSS